MREEGKGMSDDNKPADGTANYALPPLPTPGHSLISLEGLHTGLVIICEQIAPVYPRVRRIRTQNSPDLTPTFPCLLIKRRDEILGKAGPAKSDRDLSANS